MVCVVPCTKVLKVSACYDPKKMQLIQQFRSALGGRVLYAVAVKPDEHLSLGTLMRRLEGRMHHALGKSRFHPIIFMGGGIKPLHPNTKVSCKKVKVFKRVKGKTPLTLIRYLHEMCDEEYDTEHAEVFDLDGWEARRIRAVNPYRPAGYH